MIISRALALTASKRSCLLACEMSFPYWRLRRAVRFSLNCSASKVIYFLRIELLLFSVLKIPIRYLSQVYMETFQICKRYHNFYISVKFFLKSGTKTTSFRFHQAFLLSHKNQHGCGRQNVAFLSKKTFGILHVKNTAFIFN